MVEFFRYNLGIIMSLWWKAGKGMDEKLLRYTLRIDRRLFQKFRYIAQWEGRSANKEIEQYLKKRVAEFEKEHGEIDLSDQAKQIT